MFITEPHHRFGAGVASTDLPSLRVSFVWHPEGLTSVDPCLVDGDLESGCSECLDKACQFEGRLRRHDGDATVINDYRHIEPERDESCPEDMDSVLCMHHAIDTGDPTSEWSEFAFQRARRD